jgi:hypothetical protein
VGAAALVADVVVAAVAVIVEAAVRARLTDRHRLKSVSMTTSYTSEVLYVHIMGSIRIADRGS